MRDVCVDGGVDAWREAARDLLKDDVSPEHVAWRDSASPQASLLAEEAWPTRPHARRSTLDAQPTVPRRFLQLAATVACHRDPTRWDALYRVLWRLSNGEPSLLEVATDPDVHRLLMMERAVRRAIHKMHAFVRFRAVGAVAASGEVRAAGDEPVYAAWFEPAHPVVERAVPLFVRRFRSMRWSVLTPDRCAHWDGEALTFGPGVPSSLAPREDALEELWRSYYAQVFNPARLAPVTMRAEMPKRYWANLPEARLIPELTREAPRRVAAMIARALGEAEELPRELDDDGARRSVLGGSRGAAEPRSIQLRRASASPRELHLPSAERREGLTSPSPFDPLHDPGTIVARERADAVRRRAPFGLLLGDVPVRVGVASWTDATTTSPGVFYPDHVRTPEERLRHYASRFPLVEVDATYYAMPARSTAAAWAARTPEHFVFDVKAFALMTGHAAEVKRLPDWLRRALPRTAAAGERVYARDLPTALVDEVWRRFMGALDPLRSAGKLGPVLLQFPRWFSPSRESADVLRAARERLGDAAAAVELRNPEWVSDRLAPRTFALLERLGLAYVIVDAPPGTASSMPPVVRVTTPDLAVVRLHGRRRETWEARNDVVSERYRYLYDSDELRTVAERVVTAAGMIDVAYAKQGVHVVHNNCHANYGTTNADEITQMLIEWDEERRGL